MAKQRCSDSIKDNPFWSSQLAEPRTADAVEAAWNLIDCMHMYIFVAIEVGCIERCNLVRGIHAKHLT